MPGVKNKTPRFLKDKHLKKYAEIKQNKSDPIVVTKCSINSNKRAAFTYVVKKGTFLGFQ